jgi:hypothetical protein
VGGRKDLEGTLLLLLLPNGNGRDGREVGHIVVVVVKGVGVAVVKGGFGSGQDFCVTLDHVQIGASIAVTALTSVSKVLADLQDSVVSATSAPAATLASSTTASALWVVEIVVESTTTASGIAAAASSTIPPAATTAAASIAGAPLLLVIHDDGGGPSMRLRES